MTDLTHALGSIEPVKPLEWEEHCADTVIGSYWYFVGTSVRLYRKVAGEGDVGREVHSSEDEAKAAAQADYSARILSALSPEYLERVRAMEAENARLREALEPFADQAASFDSDGTEFVPNGFHPSHAEHTIGDLRRARAALSNREDGE